MVSPLERRRFSRFIIPLPVEYYTCLADSGEVQQGRGVVRDISLGGSYVRVPAPASFQMGQILFLTIAAPLPYQPLEGLSHFKAQGEVIRIDHPGPDSSCYGIALKFLTSPSFAPA